MNLLAQSIELAHAKQAIQYLLQVLGKRLGGIEMRKHLDALEALGLESYNQHFIDTFYREHMTKRYKEAFKDDT